MAKTKKCHLLLEWHQLKRANQDHITSMVVQFSGLDAVAMTLASYFFESILNIAGTFQQLSPFLSIRWLRLCMNNVCCFSLLSYHSGRKKAPSGPPGPLCQGHLSATVFRCVWLHSSQHAAWLHKTPSAWKCPTAGRPRLHQSCCAAPTRVPLPPVPDSLHQLASHLSLLLSVLLLFAPQKTQAGCLRGQLHACFNIPACSPGQSLCVCVCVCLVEWQRGQL